MESKTPEYTKKAIAKYKSKFDHVNVALPLGTKEKIKDISGVNPGAFIRELVIKELEKY